MLLKNWNIIEKTEKIWLAGKIAGMQFDWMRIQNALTFIIYSYESLAVILIFLLEIL